MTSEGIVVLIIDDEPELRRTLRQILKSNGYQVHEAESGSTGLVRAGQLRPDIILLDLGLPDMEGITVLRALREWHTLPIIVLSARHAEAQKVAALDTGADDYATKPFGNDELLARLRVAQRRLRPSNVNNENEQIVHFANITVDFARRNVQLAGEPVKLTPTEYSLLRFFIENADKALTHAQILRAVWGPQYTAETHYLRVYMAQLRQKLEADANNPQLFITEPGVGYRLVLPD